MARTITQRELRNSSGDIMRALDRGESFLVTRNGVPVGELAPVAPREFIDTRTLIALLAGVPSVDAARLRADLDAVVDQDPTPRA